MCKKKRSRIADLQAGIVLAELLVSLSLASILVALFLSLVGTSVVRQFRSMHHTEAMLERSSGLLWFIHDLKHCSQDRSSWIKTSKASMVFKKKGDIACGYQVNRGNLIRYQGTYHTHTGRWGKGARSVILHGIRAVSFHFWPGKNNTKLSGVTVQLKTQTAETIVCDVAFSTGGDV